MSLENSGRLGLQSGCKRMILWRVSIPLFARKILSLSPQNDAFFKIKAVAAGVILATGFIHISPEAFDCLTSPCVDKNPWGTIPFAGFVAMMSAIGRLMIDSLATSALERKHSSHKPQQVNIVDTNMTDTDDDGDHVVNIEVLHVRLSIQPCSHKHTSPPQVWRSPPTRSWLDIVS